MTEVTYKKMQEEGLYVGNVKIITPNEDVSVVGLGSRIDLEYNFGGKIEAEHGCLVLSKDDANYRNDLEALIIHDEMPIGKVIGKTVGESISLNIREVNTVRVTKIEKGEF